MSCRCTFELNVAQRKFSPEPKSDKYENMRCEDVLEFFRTLNNRIAYNPQSGFWTQKYTVKYEVTEGDRTLANKSEETPDLAIAKIELFMKDQGVIPKTKNESEKQLDRNNCEPSLDGYWYPLGK